MSAIRNRVRRIREAIAATASTGRTTYRRPNGETLALDDGPLLDAFLAVMAGDAAWPFSDRATAFLADCFEDPSRCDLENWPVRQAREILGWDAPAGRDGTSAHSGPELSGSGGLTLPQSAVDEQTEVAQ